MLLYSIGCIKYILPPWRDQEKGKRPRDLLLYLSARGVASSLVKTYLARNASLIDRGTNCALWCICFPKIPHRTCTTHTLCITPTGVIGSVICNHLFFSPTELLCCVVIRNLLLHSLHHTIYGCHWCVCVCVGYLRNEIYISTLASVDYIWFA
jgi:hypothetical protein